MNYRNKYMETGKAKQVINKHFIEERPLFKASHIDVVDCVFDKGESPLKEAFNVNIMGGSFNWKYPLWYAENIDVRETYFAEMARAGIWYSDNVSISDCVIDAPKEFRKCRGLNISEVKISNAAETLWWCENVNLRNVEATGDYFAMGSKNLIVNGLKLTGNYSFDGCEDVVIENSKLMSKDCIWNCRNVVIRDSFIDGEYLAWNSHNVTLINCDIVSLQGLCYVDGLIMRNCHMAGSTLTFEYSNVDVEVVDKIDSVMNPLSGRIKAPRIDKLIMDNAMVDLSKTAIEAEVGTRLDEFDGVIYENE